VIVILNFIFIFSSFERVGKVQASARRLPSSYAFAIPDREQAQISFPRGHSHSEGNQLDESRFVSCTAREAQPRDTVEHALEPRLRRIIPRLPQKHLGSTLPILGHRQGHNRCAIAVRLQRNRCAIAVQSLRNRRIITAHTPQNHCAITAQSLSSRCAIAEQSPQNHYAITAQS
jgi:hypothetical protein